MCGDMICVIFLKNYLKINDLFQACYGMSNYPKRRRDPLFIPSDLATLEKESSESIEICRECFLQARTN